MPQAGASTGTPARIEACRAGFCPAPAAKICPMMTSDTSPGSTPARSSAARMATFPNSWAGRLASEPLKAPTGVRVALAMTMVDWSVLIICSTATGVADSGLHGARRLVRQPGDKSGFMGNATGLSLHRQPGVIYPPRPPPLAHAGPGLRCSVVVAYALQKAHPVKP